VFDLTHPKLKKLAETEGYDDVMAFLEWCAFDSICPAICMNEHCDYTTGMEPDQRRGWCDECQANTMKSALVIAGAI
jgi:hypothetical protein